MKKLLSLLVVLALSSVGLHAQSTNAISIPAPPTPARPVEPVVVKLTAAQTSAIQTRFATGFSLPSGMVLVGLRFFIPPGQTTGIVIVQVQPTAPVTTQ